MMKHELRTWPEFFQAAWVGDKNFEIRKNDRHFQERDEIVLQEWNPKMEDACGDHEKYTGREIEGIITYLTDWNQKDDMIVFSWRETSRCEG